MIRRTRSLKKRKKEKLPRTPRPRCGRPCARQRQVPAVRPPDSVHRRFLDIPVVQQRQVPTVHTLLVQFLVAVDVPVVATTGARFYVAENCGLVLFRPEMLCIMVSMDQQAWFAGFLRCSSRCVPFSVFRPKMPVFMAGLDHKTVGVLQVQFLDKVFYMPVVVLRVVFWSRQCSIGGSAVAVHHGRYSLLFCRGISPWSRLFR